LSLVHDNTRWRNIVLGGVEVQPTAGGQNSSIEHAK
jgi:hypothetical protein